MQLAASGPANCRPWDGVPPTPSSQAPLSALFGALGGPLECAGAPVTSRRPASASGPAVSNELASGWSVLGGRALAAFGGAARRGTTPHSPGGIGARGLLSRRRLYEGQKRRVNEGEGASPRATEGTAV